MKTLIKKSVQSALIWAAFVLGAIGMSVAYAALNYLTPVGSATSGSGVSASEWNRMVANFVTVDTKLEAVVPTGAVMAFNLASCPNGWSAFSQANGKTVVWVGNDGQGNAYSLLNSWGEARHTLTTAEMPNHNHAVTASDVLNTGAFIVNDHSWDGIVSSDNFNPAYIETRSNRYFTDGAGGSQSHENRMPYVALLYCVKN